MSTHERINQMTEGGSGRPPIKSTASKGLNFKGIKLSSCLLPVLMGLAIVCLIQTAMAGDYQDDPNLITTTTSGVVNGSLYVNATQPVVFGSQELGEDHSFYVTFNLPNNVAGNVTWARLYEVWYSGSGTNNYGVEATTEFNRDNVNDVTYTTLGPESMAIQSGTDGHCYWVNDHVSKVYSDYMIWYDVTNLIESDSTTVHLSDTEVEGYPYVDGRLKAVQLIIAYNNSSCSNLTYYWVNQGQEWFNGVNGAYPNIGVDTAEFDTSSLLGQTASAATLTELSTSSGDGYYHIHNLDEANELTRDTGYQPYINHHAWDVTGNLTNIPSSTLFYFANSPPLTEWGGSYQIQTATLAIKI